MAKITPERKEAAKEQLEQFRTTVKYDTRDYPIELIISKVIGCMAIYYDSRLFRKI